MPPPDPLSALDAEARIEAVADRFLAALQAGSGVDPQALVEAHPDLGPGLKARLAVVSALFHGAKRAEIAGGGHGDDSLALPRRIGRFEVTDHVGRGTFGDVFEALDLDLGRTVAVKVPRLGAFASGEEEERFLREARSAAQLKHPAIVQVHEIGRDDGVPFLVCDFIDGETLAARMTRSPPSYEESAELVSQVADALDYAHRHKVVHRDIKPQNILLDRSGRPHVTDFGLASLQDDDAQVTLDGQVLGTPAYMPPEQAAGKRGAADARSDVYSLGVVLYELLTAERPFRGERSVVVHRVLHEDPRSPRTINYHVPRDLETICLKAMAKEPGRRYGTAEELASDLRRYLRGEPILARPAGAPERMWRWCRRNKALASLAATVLLLLVATAVGSSIAALHVDQARKSVTSALAESRSRLVHMTALSGQRSWSSGDNMGAMLWFAEALREDGGDPAREIEHRQRYAAVRRQTPRLVTAFCHDSWVLWAEIDARGSLVATASHDGTGRVWSAASGDPVTPPLRHRGAVHMVSFRPDGRAVVTAGGDGTAQQWDAESGAELGPALRHGAAVRVARYSPGGDALLTASDDGTVRVWHAGAGSEVVSLVHAGPVLWADFSPDGRRVASAGADGAVKVAPARGGETLLLQHPKAVHHVVFHPCDPALATSGADGKLRVWRRLDGEPHEALELAGGGRPWVRAAFNPAGDLLSAVSESSQHHVWDAGTGRKLATLNHPGLGCDLAFSPDGLLLATVTNDFTARVWHARTGEQVGPTLSHGNLPTRVVFSGDGRRLLSAGYDRAAKIWALPPADLDDPNLALAARSHHLRYSPDGKRVIGIARDGSVQCFDAGSGERIPPSYPRHAPDPMREAVFSPDGRIVAALAAAGPPWLWEAASGTPLASPLEGAGEISRCLFSPDSERMALLSRDGAVSLWSLQVGVKLLCRLEIDGGILDMGFGSGGTLITVGLDAACTRWDASTGRPGSVAQTLPPLEAGATGVRAVLSPDGARVAFLLASFDAAIHDTTGGRCLGRVQHHTGYIFAAAFSRDGLRFATASGDGSIRIWNAVTVEAAAPMIHNPGTAHLAFSADARYVAAASGATARVWSATTGLAVSAPIKLQRTIAYLEFAPHGLQIIAGRDGSARLAALPIDSRPVEEIYLEATVFSARLLDSTGSASHMSRQGFPQAWESHRSGRLNKPLPPQAASAWHRKWARSAETARAWRSAIFHLDRLAELAPFDAGVYTLRSRTRRALGDELGAAADKARSAVLRAAGGK